MKSCQKYQELISRLLDDDLSAEEQSEMERHIASCPDCRAMAEAFRALSQTIEEDQEEPPARLRENIMADVRREALRRRQTPRKLRNVLALAACAALVLLAAANLPRLRSSAPMLAASKAADAGITEAASAADYAVAEEAEAENYAADSDHAYARRDSVMSAAPAAGAEMPAAVSAPSPEPVPEPEAAPQEPAPEAAEDEPAAPRVSAWLLILVGLPLIGALVLLTLHARRRS